MQASASADVQTVAAMSWFWLLTALGATPCRHQLPAAPPPAPSATAVAVGVPVAATAAAVALLSLSDPQLPDQLPGLHHPPRHGGRSCRGGGGGAPGGAPGAGVQRDQPGPALQEQLGDPSWWTSGRGG